MSQPNRKRPHQQSPPTVKEEQQEEDTHSIGPGINGNASQCSSSNLEDTNTINNAGGGNGNGGDDINELKLKMAALEAKNQILEGKLAYQELRARLNAISEGNILAKLKQENRALWMRLNEVEANGQAEKKEMMDEFGKKLTALEAKHQQEIAGLKAINGRNRQHPNAKMPDRVVVNMLEYPGTSNNSNEIQSVASNLVPCHSANLSDCDCVNMPESHSQENLDKRLHALESRRPQKAIMAAVASLVPPPPMSVAPNLVPCNSTQQQEDGEMLDEEEPKRLCNPTGNYWNQNGAKVTMKITLPDQLIVHNSSPDIWGNIVALKGFPVFVSACRPLQQNNFSGPILYYYEIKIKSTSKRNESRLCIGFSMGSVQRGTSLGRTSNTYAMRDDKRDYCLLAGHVRSFEWPTGAIKPKWFGYGCRDVYGCGLVLSAEDKLAIFFTTNGILMGKQIAIDHHASSILYPTVCLNRDVTLEANFGQKPFKYNIQECPGLQLQW